MGLSETIVVCDIKDGRCSQLNENMNLHEYQRSSSVIAFVGHSDSTISNFFHLETAKPIEAKIYVQPPWYEGMKLSTNGLCHNTKMPPCSYMLKKTLKSCFLKPKSR